MFLEHVLNHVAETGDDENHEFLAGGARRARKTMKAEILTFFFSFKAGLFIGF